MPTACILVPVFICVLLNIVSSMLLDDIYARNANKLSRDTRCQNILRTKNTNIQRFSIAHSPLLPIFAHFSHYSNTFYTGAKNIVEIHFPHRSRLIYFSILFILAVFELLQRILSRFYYLFLYLLLYCCKEYH